MKAIATSGMTSISQHEMAAVNGGGWLENIWNWFSNSSDGWGLADKFNSATQIEFVYSSMSFDFAPCQGVLLYPD